MALCSSRSPDTIPNGQPVDTYYAFTWQHVDSQRIDSGVQIVRSTWDAGAQQRAIVWSRATTATFSDYEDGAVISIEDQFVQGPVACRMDYAGGDSRIVLVFTTSQPHGLDGGRRSPTVHRVQVQVGSGVRMDRALTPGLEYWFATSAESFGRASPLVLGEMIVAHSDEHRWGAALAWCDNSQQQHNRVLLVASGYGAVYVLTFDDTHALRDVAYMTPSGTGPYNVTGLSCLGSWGNYGVQQTSFVVAYQDSPSLYIGTIPHGPKGSLLQLDPLSQFVRSFDGEDAGTTALSRAGRVCGGDLEGILLTRTDLSWDERNGAGSCKSCGRLFLMCIALVSELESAANRIHIDVTELVMPQSAMRRAWLAAADSMRPGFGSSLTDAVHVDLDPKAGGRNITITFMVGAANLTSASLTQQSGAGVLLQYIANVQLPPVYMQTAREFTEVSPLYTDWLRLARDMTESRSCLASPWSNVSSPFATGCYTQQYQQQILAATAAPLNAECSTNLRVSNAKQANGCGT